ncbi:MAG TPA: DNA-processing protein DprA [Gammaproteobacteria bacterium]
MISDAWLAIAYAVQSPSQRWPALLARAGSPEALAGESPSALAAAGLGEEQIRRLHAPDRALLDRWRRWLEGESRALVTLGSDAYPPLLATVPDPPLVLWIEGRRPELLAAPQLAIVGSRNPTGAGRQTAEDFARYLARNGLTVTSGLASGIDAASHVGALEEPGGTIAVLGSGLDRIYPRNHVALARRIAERGLLVSEYGPGAAPERHHFPHRNRIIAGLSVGTLVVEATRRSGSLITATLARDYGREVFAIPGSIHNPLARGCHALIRQGAKLVEEAGDIFGELAALLALDMRELQAAAPPPSAPARLDDPAYAKLLECVDFAPTSITDLVERSRLTAAEVSSMLLVLELEGFVEALPGGRYSRLAKGSA